ncbi:MAG: transglycosylase domain-containing protein, partial [Burkholderiales bacterium]
MSESERAAKRPADPPASSGAALPTWARWLTRSTLWLIGLAATGVVSVVVLVGIALAVAYPNLPEIGGLLDYRPKLPMRVFSADGVLLGEYGEERRNFTPLAQIPKVMQQAVLASEDARFYEHSGVDIKGVLRAGLA